MSSIHDHDRPTQPTTDGEVPSLAVGVELLGPLAGSGYRTPPHLARRADGQTLQITPLLASVLEAVDGRRGLTEVAEVVGDAIDREVAAEDVAWLLEHRLRPLGLLAAADGSQPQVHAHRSLLGLRGRLELLSPRRTAALARPLQVLFHTPVVVTVLALFAGIVGWTIFDRGLGDPIDAALADPGLLLGIIAATILSAAFHELGHAAAARYGGATPGAIGAAVYLVWPVFFTDVTDSYRLPRADRLRVDLGGLYFNALFVLGVGAAWAVTGREGLLVLVPLTLFQMVRQLTPVVRFDGYHILADLVGVPDLFARIKPTLAGALPGRRGQRDANPLRPWAQAVVVTWVAVVIPTLLVMLALLVVNLPAMIVQAAGTLGRQAQVLAANVGAGQVDASVLGVIAMITVAFIPVSAVYLMGRIGGRGVKRFWSATQGRSVLRTVGSLGMVGLLVAAGPQLAAVPRDVVLAATAPFAETQDAIVTDVVQPSGEGDLVAAFPAQGDTSAGTDLAALSAMARTDGHVVDVQVTEDPARAASYAADRREAKERRDATPVKAPKPAKVEAPAPAPAPEAPAEVVEVVEERPDLLGSEATWPFAFPRPAAPDVDDNQVVVVNQTDGTSRFDLRTDVAWTTGEVFDPVNQAYALAQCVDCRTVAVAFQVVAAVDATRTAVPQNLALAGNVDCEACTTRSVAVQLAVTLTSPPEQSVKTAVGALVTSIDARRDEFAGMDPDVVLAELQAVREEALFLLQPFMDGDAVEDLPGRDAAPLAEQPAQKPEGLAMVDAPAPAPAPVLEAPDGATALVEVVPSDVDLAEPDLVEVAPSDVDLAEPDLVEAAAPDTGDPPEVDPPLEPTTIAS